EVLDGDRRLVGVQLRLDLAHRGIDLDERLLLDRVAGRQAQEEGGEGDEGERTFHGGLLAQGGTALADCRTTSLTGTSLWVPLRPVGTVAILSSTSSPSTTLPKTQ